MMTTTRPIIRRISSLSLLLMLGMSSYPSAILSVSAFIIPPNSEQAIAAPSRRGRLDMSSSSSTSPSPSSAQTTTTTTTTTSQKQTQRQQSYPRSSSSSKYKRKRGIPVTEQKLKHLSRQRQAEYDKIMARNNVSNNNKGNSNNTAVSIWSFESLFPEPKYDEESIQKDLYGQVADDDDNDDDTERSSRKEKATTKTSILGGSNNNNKESRQGTKRSPLMGLWGGGDTRLKTTSNNNNNNNNATTTANNNEPKIDRDLTRLVEDRVFGYRRTGNGDYQYETSLLEKDRAVQFRQGVRLGNPLKINPDRLTYFAKKELQHGRVEEAAELYEQAVRMDARDGRAYLGLSRCAERRRDFCLARKYLQLGIQNSVSVDQDDVPDRGANPFLLQALGCLEEKAGNLAQAEHLYKEAANSRPSHAAAWVALAQIRTRKLGCPAAAGRVCFESAKRELELVGKKPSSYVCTAWANLEYHKAGDTRKARKLFQKALEIDPKCSAAWLQLGVLEADSANWDEATRCFESVLKFDQRNSRVLQAYGIMETKRPDGNSRKAIGLFERALEANPRDAGVLQPYALFVAELGDLDAARELLQRGTRINKRHAPVWQAWGVLETRHGNPNDARNIFQQGIWACGQLTGGQSGGYHCARLWQAWGVLEAKEGDHAAARRCFSRALDANDRNVPAVTAWAIMEEELGNINDARMIFERALRKFTAGSNDKMILWRSYELMEQRIGDVEAAQAIYERSMRETFTTSDNDHDFISTNDTQSTSLPEIDEVLRNTRSNSKNEVEVVRWESTGGEVWMNDRAIEGKVPLRKNSGGNKKQK